MATLDPRIEAIRERYGLVRDDFWELPQKKGAWLVKHAALEVAAVKANIRFDMPVIVEAASAEGVCSMCVQGSMGDRVEWSMGEASPKNSKIAYPWAICEKRAKDRVILKLIGIHGLVYSEDEADDFKAPANGHEALNTALVASTREPPPATALDANGKPFKHGMRIEPEMRELWTELKNELDGAPSLAALRVKWHSRSFQEEYARIKPDWQEELIAHCDQLIAMWTKLTGDKAVVPPDFDAMGETSERP